MLIKLMLIFVLALSVSSCAELHKYKYTGSQQQIENQSESSLDQQETDPYANREYYPIPNVVLNRAHQSSSTNPPGE